MNIYKLAGDVSSFRQIEYSNTFIKDILMSNRPVDCSGCPEIDLKWTPDSIEFPIGDCPFITGSLPVFSKKITDQLSSGGLISGINMVPLTIEGEPYSLMIAQNRLANTLNKRKSKIESFPDGRIITINRYVFRNTIDYPEWFVIEEYPFYTFVNERVKKVLDQIKPEGLIMENCLCSN